MNLTSIALKVITAANKLLDGIQRFERLKATAVEKGGAR
jgi:hypothetical protein